MVVETVPWLMTRGTDIPSGTLKGTETLIWSTPTMPGANPEYSTDRFIPPRVTVGGTNEYASGLEGEGCPLTTVGEV